MQRAAGVRYGQRRHRDRSLSLHVQRAPARHDDLRSRRDRQETWDLACGVEHLLEVVEDEEHLPFSQVVLEDLVHRSLPPFLPQPERGGDRWKHQHRISHGRQVHEEDTIGESGRRSRSDLDAESRLARSSRAGQRDEPALREERRRPGDLVFPAHERGELGRQADGNLEAPDRWELGGEALDHQVEQVLGVGQILQPMHAQAADRHPLGQVVLDQTSRRVRDDDLSSPPHCRDPRGPVHVEPEIVIAPEDGVACVHPHAYPQGMSLGPAVSVEPSLRLHHRSDRGAGRLEDDEERVPFGPDLHSPLLRYRVPNDR